MADPTSKIAIDGLDFFEIKSRLKQFLSTQDKFKDYNFEASGMNILLDLLSYNTHYINYYTNMVANEMFLDTATVRDSVVSHAKLLGYTPSSNTGARAKVSLTVPAEADGSPTIEFLPKYSIFSANLPNIGNVAFTFRNLQAYKFEPKSYNSSGIILEYWIPEIEIAEGKSTITTYIVDTSNNPSQRFVIPESNVDISSLKIRVQTSTSDLTGYDKYWERVIDPIQLNQDSLNYFVQETENGKFEVYFGDDVVGKGVRNGNVVIMEYIITVDDPTLANGLGTDDEETKRTFKLEGSEFANPDVAVIQNALGGAVRETTDSIKYYAPRGFQAQDRAVTVEDYAYTIAKEYPFADSVYVWGGEDNSPPVYGRVFVSIKPKRGTSLTNQEKEAIKSGILKRFNVVGISPEIIDPDYTYLRFNTTIKMNQAKTTRSPNEVKEVVKNAIASFVNDNLGKFGGNLLTSRLATTIDSSETSVEASGTGVTLQKQILPNYGSETNYTAVFANPIEPSTIDTNLFLHYDSAKQNFQNPYSVAFLKDDGAGNIDVVTYEPLPTSARITVGSTTTTTTTLGGVGKVSRVLKRKAGSVNYSSGIVDLPNFNIAGLSGANPVFKVNATPSNYAEIVADKNQLLVLQEDDPTSNSVDVKLTTDGRLNSPSAVRNQPSFQSRSTTTSTTTTTTTATNRNAASSETQPTPKGYPKC